jgi:hypothetical protein
MKIFDRSKYLGYYFSRLNWGTLKKFINYTHGVTSKSSLSIWADVISCVYKYNIGIMDYFIFRFFEKDETERQKWIGTGFKYEFDLRMNPKESRDILENKLKFYDAYSQYIKHAFCSLHDLKGSNEKAEAVLNNKSGKLVVKDSIGQCGFEVEVLNTKDYNASLLAKYMSSKGFDMAEEFVIQHDQINKLSPSGLNTVRVMTLVDDEGDVQILGARLRISVNSHVDNLASGNIAAPINLKTGAIDRMGVYSDITKENVSVHPVTGESITGFRVPFWQETIEASKKIALAHPQNRGVGWDVAITPTGPDFIEGNHNWCKILYQLPVGLGLKSVLESYES